MKTIKSSFTFFVLLTVLLACASNRTDQANQEASASISGLNGNPVSGTADFVQDGDEVELELNLQGLPPGNHAVHIHTGTCGDTTTIGDHWNPTGAPHGQRGVDEAFHRGDIGNIEIGSDSTGTLTLSAEDWTIGGSDSTNVIGNLVIVHAGADDYTSQPSGNAGDMIGCGTIQ